MNTIIYLVRHGDSPKEGNERTRELTEKGYRDAERVAEVLKEEDVDVVASSPYRRSVLTVEKVAKTLHKEVVIIEELKERIFSPKGTRLSDKELAPLLEQSFLDPHFSLEGGESNNECQKRAVKVVKDLINTYEGKKIVIGSHGAVMTLIMNHFDPRCDLQFLNSMTKPDIYKLTLHHDELMDDVERLWESV
ncbi:histidine phosphatase family protein [Priestia koreensis]|uniref:histidine phosphatase family protein n=1 Tax=Priestia koreensis TaxID=284581 RepID=UPI0028F6F6D7|nr:histidine phosphatase family protein [Priestia koreensis]